MPLFMDFHKIDSDAFTEEDMYRAHLRDIAVQNKHGMIYKKYYLNLHQKTAFCLMESPNKEACIESHKEAHGIGACNVIEVSRENEFFPYMGEGGQNEHDLALTLSGEIDSGYRTLMLVDVIAMTEEDSILKSQIRKCIENHKGSVVKLPLNHFMVSFIDASDAILAALEIRSLFESFAHQLEYSLALATGKPVDEKGSDLFGETKNTVRTLARMGLTNTVFIDLATQTSATKGWDELELESKSILVFNDADLSEIKRIEEVLYRNLSNSNFKSEHLGSELGLSKTQLYRKVSALTALTPNRLLSEVRLRSALRAIKAGSKNVSEIAYDSGFNSPTYFTRVFRNRFEVLPTALKMSNLS